MKTATQGFVISPPDTQAPWPLLGRTLSGAQCPFPLRWWLLTGGLLRHGSRR